MRDQLNAGATSVNTHHPRTQSNKANDDYEGQMIFVDLVGLKLPDIYLRGEEKPRKKKLTKETCPDRASNPCMIGAHGLKHLLKPV